MELDGWIDTCHHPNMQDPFTVHWGHYTLGSGIPFQSHDEIFYTNLKEPVRLEHLTWIQREPMKQ